MMGSDGNMQRSDYVFHSQFLEEISSLPDKEKSAYGHQMKRLIEDCTFGGANCDWLVFFQLMVLFNIVSSAFLRKLCSKFDN